MASGCIMDTCIVCEEHAWEDESLNFVIIGGKGRFIHAGCNLQHVIICPHCNKGISIEFIGEEKIKCDKCNHYLHGESYFVFEGKKLCVGCYEFVKKKIDEILNIHV